MKPLFSMIAELILLAASLAALVYSCIAHRNGDFNEAIFMLGMSILLQVVHDGRVAERKFTSLEDRIKYEQILRRGTNGEQQDKE